jgi:hypothetical protein
MHSMRRSVFIIYFMFQFVNKRKGLIVSTLQYIGVWNGLKVQKVKSLCSNPFDRFHGQKTIGWKAARCICAL